MARTIKVRGEDVAVVGVGFSERVQNALTSSGSALRIAAPTPDKNTSRQVEVSDEIGQSSVTGKIYPGFRMDYRTARMVSRQSLVINSIIKLRIGQVAMLPIEVVPIKSEPPRQFSILKYDVHDIERHPAFDSSDKTFLIDLFERLDPDGVKTDKRQVFKEKKEELSAGDVATADYLQDKHDDFYKKREEDIRKIENLLRTPDPDITSTKTWNSLVAKIGEDLLVLDRAVILKVRDKNSGEIKVLMPLDGSTIRPVTNQYGFISKEKAYVQVSTTGLPTYLKKDDVIVMMMNPVTDTMFFGYGVSPMETLYYVVLSELFIDKGNLAYYQKGGSIPEGFIAVEPPASKEGQLNVIDQSQLDAMQRQMQAIIMGDFTQIPIVSGGKFSWIDFKGKRKDMQFKELADMVSRKICAVMQVSPQDIGILDGVKSSDGEVQADLTKSKGLRTIMSAISDYITNEVINELRPEKDLKLWFEEPEDKEADKAWGTQAKLAAGYLSINEARAKENLPPRPWGDTPLQSLSKNWKGEEAGAAGALPALPGMPPPPGGAGTPPPGGGLPPALPSPGGDMMKSADEIIKDALFTSWEDSDTLDVSSLAEKYIKSAIFKEDEIIEEIAAYKPSLKPVKEYSRISERLGIPSTVLKSANPDDIVMFSKSDSSGITLGSGSETFVSAATKYYLENGAKREEIRKSFGENSKEAVEYAMVSMIESPKVRDELIETVYKYKRRKLSDYQIEQARRIIE